ncbi:hypothetical protein PROFUN_16093 [Planoprotostelium fungivorum]|uniref:Uncharacterized protein n=1 Tax=Planoprotostelium fungivorum TaxID=1890364 RepID=A0A2P6MT87_9EUKA|nr:hypothetical protein PROFUN_16093 [Planoprotostelium fungivorum]
MTNNISTDGFGDIHSQWNESPRGLPVQMDENLGDDIVVDESPLNLLSSEDFALDSDVLSTTRFLPRQLSTNLGSVQLWDRKPSSQDDSQEIEVSITGPTLPAGTTATICITLLVHNKHFVLYQSVDQISVDGRFTLPELSRIPQYHQITDPGRPHINKKTEMRVEIVVELEARESEFNINTFHELIFISK